MDRLLQLSAEGFINLKNTHSGNNMKNQLKCQVVMLPTEKAENCLIKNDGGLFWKYPIKDYFTQSYLKSVPAKSLHLYFTSDRNMVEGDWEFYAGKLIRQFSGGRSVKGKRIEATTDPSLVYLAGYGGGETVEEAEVYEHIPQIPESFIQAYVKANGEIKEVMIELTEDFPGLMDPSPIIKLRPNNTVIIHQSKLYTRDEVIKLLGDCWNESSKVAQKYNMGTEGIFIRWIEENL